MIRDPKDFPAAYAAAVRAKDADALLALYAPAVRVFDLWDGWATEGREAWRGAVGQWFGSLGEETVRVEFADVRVTDGGALALLDAIVTYASLGPDGTELRSMQNRVTWGIARAGDGACAIVHEHTSAPIDSSSFKPILRRA